MCISKGLVRHCDFFLFRICVGLHFLSHFLIFLIKWREDYCVAFEDL